MSNPPSMPVKSREHSRIFEHPSNVVETGFNPCHDIDVTKRDRFELLSAYLDGEVTPEERQMVLDWMKSDPKAKGLYNRLIRLRQGFREGGHSPCYDADATVSRVFQCLNYRMQLVGMAGFGVFVLGVLSVLSGSAGHHQSIWRMVSNPQAEYLEIALDQPAFPIPKAPTAAATLEGANIDNQGVLPIDSEL